MTRDQKTVEIQAAVFYQIYDPEKSVLEVSGSIDQFVAETAASLLRDAISSRVLKDVLEKKHEMNKQMKVS